MVLTPATTGWTLILGGCCANVLSLEFISSSVTHRDKSAGNLITFAQFLFIAIEGLIGQFDFRLGRLTPRKIPLVTYISLTSLFFLASLLNNLALNWNISMPVHTVFRSSGLAGTLLTGFLFFGKRYSKLQVSSSLIICIGIVVLTLADAHTNVRKLASCCGDQAHAVTRNESSPTASSPSSSAPITASLNSTNDFIVPLAEYFGLGPLVTSILVGIDFRWLTGICMLTSTLFMLAILGHIQEKTYAKYGKVWREVVCWTHVISLPFFLFTAPSICATLAAWSSSASWPTVHMLGYDITMPMHIPLLVNLITQSICLKGVAILTSHTSTLTCTIAMTLRKVISLVLSIIYFGNEFTREHWFGTLLVFGGILAYANEGRWAKKSTAATSTVSPNSRSNKSPQSIDDWLKSRGIEMTAMKQTNNDISAVNGNLDDQQLEKYGYITTPTTSNNTITLSPSSSSPLETDPPSSSSSSPPSPSPSSLTRRRKSIPASLTNEELKVETRSSARLSAKKKSITKDR